MKHDVKQHARRRAEKILRNVKTGEIKKVQFAKKLLENAGVDIYSVKHTVERRLMLLALQKVGGIRGKEEKISRDP